MPTNLSIPWLDNGMIAQLPVRLEILKLAPANRFADGSVIVNAAEARSQYRWTLRYENLDIGEWQRFTEFFAAAEGGSASFTFYDPLGNLLSQTGNLASSVWVKPAGLDVAPIADPDHGEAFILTNGTASPLALTQTVGVAGSFETCFSVLAKWQDSVAFSLSQADAFSSGTRNVQAFAWAKHSVVLRGSPDTESRTISIVVPPTTQIIVAEPQLEIASAAGPYVESGASGGIFPVAWLNQRQIDLQSKAPGAHSFTLLVESIRRS